eukprot:41693-Alexandrium_andersonii.AAC.1
MCGAATRGRQCRFSPELQVALAGRSARLHLSKFFARDKVTVPTLANGVAARLSVAAPLRSKTLAGHAAQ